MRHQFRLVHLAITMHVAQDRTLVSLTHVAVTMGYRDREYIRIVPAPMKDALTFLLVLVTPVRVNIYVAQRTLAAQDRIHARLIHVAQPIPSTLITGH